MLLTQEWLDMVVGRIVSTSATSPSTENVGDGPIRRAQDSWAQVGVGP